uniref:E4 ORF1 n=1 Tax=Bat mastadenovirus TaxID=740971 RepID=A0A8G0W1A0_9ADEN|nr:E4 ORF1 [Bat mastadenovirus]
MAPVSQELAWTFEIRVADTGYGDWHFDGQYLELILKYCRDYINRDYDFFVASNDLNWLSGWHPLYLGGFIRRYSSNELSSLYICLGSPCFYGGDHTTDPHCQEFAASITEHIKACFVELGFSPELECVPVRNEFQSV